MVSVQNKQQFFFLLPRCFLIYAAILIVSSAEKRNPILLYWCTLGITLLPVIVTLFSFSRKQNLGE